MKFGKLTSEYLHHLDLSLPPDHPNTNGVLKRGSHKLQVYVGCAKWGRPEWVNLIYPSGTKSTNFLDEYVKNFNAIEMNTTFYKIKKSDVESWVDKAPKGFKFSPKFNRSITHIKRINEDSQRYTDYFLDCCHAFGDNLGASFLQLPENFAGKYLERLTEYISKLPEDFPLFVELRHESWFNDQSIFDETFAMLAEYGKGAVITDVAGRRDVLHQRLTVPGAFIRFNGYGLIESDYKRMDDWVERIKDWSEKGLEEVYFYVHQENEAHTPITADYFIKKVNAFCGVDVKRPNFMNK